MVLRKIRLPLTPSEARSLRLGELVLADGEAIITAGLPTHQRIARALEDNAPLPLDLRGQAFFHMGLCAEEANGALAPLYVNPTTSTRFAAHMPAMIRSFGLTAIAGKGGLDRASVDAMADVGCVYLSMVGGASSILSGAVKSIVETGWDDLIMQFRLSRIQFEGLGPMAVAVDAHGASLYADLAQAARRKLPAILAQLAARRQER